MSYIAVAIVVLICVVIAFFVVMYMLLHHKFGRNVMNTINPLVRPRPWFIDAEHGGGEIIEGIRQSNTEMTFVCKDESGHEFQTRNLAEDDIAMLHPFQCMSDSGAPVYCDAIYKARLQGKTAEADLREQLQKAIEERDQAITDKLALQGDMGHQVSERIQQQIELAKANKPAKPSFQR